MRQPQGEVAVVGEQQRALGVAVEPPDGIDAARDELRRQEIEHGGASLRIVGGGDGVGWFVQQQIDMRIGGGAHELAAQAHLVHGRG